MPIAALPPTVFAPLTSNESLIVAIQAASGESHSTVLDRLLAEEECLGINVRRDAAAFGLKPYVWSDQLIEFYRSTKSFLYETAVWNRTPLKQQMREWIGRFLQRNGLCTAKVLTFGDGLGFDSTFLALLGCDVTYYEPSEECSRFASEVFRQNAVSIRHASTTDSLPAAGFDVVICLDVLEHVPAPPETVASFAGWLRPEGCLITHSPFFYIEPYHPTHLRKNQCYSGNDQFFIKNGLQPYDGNFFWDPIVLKKSPLPPADRRLTAVRLGQPLLKLGSFASTVHCLVARAMSRRDRKWADNLRAMKVAGHGESN